MERRSKSVAPVACVETARIAGLMEESAAAYQRAWVAFHKSKCDLEKVRNRVQKTRDFGRLPHDQLENF